MSAPVAAVTGGTGFLGRYCVAALAASGWRVRLLVRRDPVHPMLRGIATELVLGDLDDAAALSRLVAGASAVVHVAGLVKARSAAAFDAVNRDGTARLARVAAAEAAGCRFVLVSSMAARAPELSAYAASKQAGERALVATAGALRWVILRPGVVYGPWDTEGAKLLEMAQRRLVPHIGAARQGGAELRIAMIHARDAAAAVGALCGGGPSSVVFELSDARVDGYRWPEIVAAASAGRPARFMGVPDALVMAAGAAQAAWSALSGRPAVFGRGKAREILHRDWASEPARQPPADVWRPRISLAEGMRETEAWRAALKGHR